MGTLFGALNSSVSALDAYQNALNVVQENVSNASTPGYANQSPTFVAQPFNLSQGLVGGVNAGPTQSSDSHYADQAVQNQLSLLGNYTAQSTALSPIQGLFDVTGQTGVLGALNNLFQSFSAWAATPGSSADQQAVLSQASQLASAFNAAAGALSQTTTQLNQQINSTVEQINSLASQIAMDNASLAQSSQPNAGVQANIEASLESLSKLANISVTFSSNGEATVLLAGQTPLVAGTQQYSIQASFNNVSSVGNPNAVPNAEILDAAGEDIAGQISQGTLGGLLNVRNTVIPSLQGDSQQQGALNILAQQVADRVNAILTSGTTPDGSPGTELFTYNTSTSVDVAATLAVNPAITAAGLAPANGSSGNGTALQLANLGDSTAPADTIAGLSINQYAAATATQVGQQAANAQNGQTIQTQLVSQAQAVQTQISGVNLNAEAALVIQLQQGYDAAGKVINVIDSLATTLINMIPAAA